VKVLILYSINLNTQYTLKQFVINHKSACLLILFKKRRITLYM